MSAPVAVGPTDEAKATAAVLPVLGPITVRSATLWLIAVLLLFHTLVAASSLLIPIHLAILANLALSPVVRLLERMRLPPPLGAALVLATVLAFVIALGNVLSAPAAEWFDRAPASLAQIERKIRVATRPLEEVRRATKSVESLVDIEGETAQVQVSPPSLLRSLLSGTQDFVAYAAVVVVLLYFLLSGGDSFLRKLVTILPQLSDKRRAVEIARRTEREISRYLLSVCLINLVLAAVVASALWVLEMPNPLLWGAVTGLLNFVPFLGPTLSVLLILGASILSFDTPQGFLLPPLACASITAFEGMIATPAILGRRLTLSPVVIFLGILSLSWVWGIVGALVAVPTLVMLKIACDEIEGLHAVGILMEAEPRA